MSRHPGWRATLGFRAQIPCLGSPLDTRPESRASPCASPGECVPLCVPGAPPFCVQTFPRRIRCSAYAETPYITTNCNVFSTARVPICVRLACKPSARRALPHGAAIAAAESGVRLGHQPGLHVARTHPAGVSACSVSSLWQ